MVSEAQRRQTQAAPSSNPDITLERAWSSGWWEKDHCQRPAIKYSIICCIPGAFCPTSRWHRCPCRVLSPLRAYPDRNSEAAVDCIVRISFSREALCIPSFFNFSAQTNSNARVSHGGSGARAWVAGGSVGSPGCTTRCNSGKCHCPCISVALTIHHF